MGRTLGRALWILAILVAAQPATGHDGAYDPAAQAKIVIEECRAKRISGELKNSVASAQCAGPLVIQAYEKAQYRYMDLILLTVAKQTQIAERFDLGKMTEVEADAALQRTLTEFTDVERKRDPSQSTTAVIRSISVLQEAMDETNKVIASCRAKRLAGELKSYSASAQCSGSLTIAAFSKFNFPYMDLVTIYVAKRIEVAGRLDRNEATAIDASVEYAQAYVDFIDRDVARSRANE